jgi:AraC-like DNA-binding protein
MAFLNFFVPSYPYFIHAGNAAYRPGDKHQNRRGLDFFDIILVESGQLFMNVNGKEFSLSANDLLIIPPKTPHFGSKICTEKTFFHWMHFHTKEVFELSDMPCISLVTSQSSAFTLSLPQYQSLPEDVACNAFAVMRQLETSLIDYFTSSNTHIKPEINACHRQEFFLHLLNIICVKSKNAGENTIAYAALQYMLTHYMESLSLDTIAGILNCHPTHLIRCFKKQYGLPPTQMLIKIRLDRACSLLMDPDSSITSIAYSVGFSSASYFCKQFKKNFQYSPKEYRSHILGETPEPRT